MIRKKSMAPINKQTLEAASASMDVVGMSVNTSAINPLYDDDVNDSRDPFNEDNFDEEYWLKWHMCVYNAITICITMYIILIVFYMYYKYLMYLFNFNNQIFNV